MKVRHDSEAIKEGEASSKIGRFRAANVLCGWCDSHMMTATVTVVWLSVRDHDPQRPAAHWQGWQPCWDATWPGNMMIGLGIWAHLYRQIWSNLRASCYIQRFGPSQRLGAGSWGKMSCPTLTCFLPNPELMGLGWVAFELLFLSHEYVRVEVELRRNQ